MIKTVGGKEIILDDDDFASIPIEAEWSLDKDGYCCLRFFSQEARRTVSNSVHRYVMWAKSGQIVDHINGIKQDNRKSNLRFVTCQQNAQNKLKSPNKSSKYKGVYRITKYPKKWHTAIKFDGKSIYLGTFDTEEQAAIAYDYALIGACGKYGRTNFKYKIYE